MQKYYAFLDVVLDVFYSIILYNAFIAFPGIKIESLLMVFAVFIMLNYWWFARSFNNYPKHYLQDFYIVVIIMFIFSQWPNYFTKISEFILILAAFFFIDTLYAFILPFYQQEKRHFTIINFNLIAESLLAITYMVLWFFIKQATLLNIFLLYIPYLIFFIISIQKKLFPLRFRDNGNQPY